MRQAADSTPVPFELFLFTVDPDVARRAEEAGIDGIVVDWERAGKRRRQRLADTEINGDTPEDLERVRQATSGRILCRINPIGPRSEEEIAAAVAGGADEILVPMVRSSFEVEAALEKADGHIGVGILIETVEAVQRADELGALPLSRVYVGLNDLGIARGTPSIFTALVDGTVELVRRSIRAPFGVAGMTVPHRGEPIPAVLVAGELMRLGCSFTFLRRSFRRDVGQGDLAPASEAIRRALAAAARRPTHEVDLDQAELERCVQSLGATTPAAAVASSA